MTVQTLEQAITTLSLSIPQAYGYVIIVAAVLALEVICIGFLYPGRLRSKVFSKDFLAKNFGEEHKKTIGSEIPAGGYPDMGSGVYSQKLSYKEWFQFNNSQRVHYNFVEMAPSTFVSLLLAGLYFPQASAVLGLIVVVSRVLYSIGYMSGGPKGRSIGAIGNDIGLFGLIILAGITGWRIVNGTGP